MTWVYEQVSGRLYSDIGELIGVGYSGDPDHKNDPTAQELHNQGPIPEGEYTIGEPRNSADHGPFAMPLTPNPSNTMFGRDAFLIHGDSVKAPGTASQGCVIMSRDVRDNIWGSGDHILKVVSKLEEES